MIDITITGNTNSGKTILLALIAKTLSDNGFNNIVHVSGHETTLEIFNTKADILKTEALEHVRNQEINLIEKHCSILDLKKREYLNKASSAITNHKIQFPCVKILFPDPTTISKIKNPCNENTDHPKFKKKNTPISILLIIKGNTNKITLIKNMSSFISKFGSEDKALISLAEHAFNNSLEYSISGNILLHVVTVNEVINVNDLCIFIKTLSPGINFNSVYSNFQKTLFEQSQLILISEQFKALLNLDVLKT